MSDGPGGTGGDAPTMAVDCAIMLWRAAAQGLGLSYQPPPAASAVSGVEDSPVTLPSRMKWANVPLPKGCRNDEGQLSAADAAAAAAATSYQLLRFGLGVEHQSRWSYAEVGMAAYGLAGSTKEALRCQLARMLARGHDAFILDLVKATDVPDGVLLPPPVLIHKGGEMTAYTYAHRSLALLADGVTGRYGWAPRMKCAALRCWWTWEAC